MNQPDAILCPRCKKLISSYLAECSYCGLPEPAKQARLAKLVQLPSLVTGLLWANGMLFGLSYLLPILLYGQWSAGQGMLGLPSPPSVSLALLGWADPLQIVNGHYWLLVTALFLHGGILHLVFNLLWIRDLGQMAEGLLGPAKMLLIYLVSGVAGNLLAVWTPFFMEMAGFEARHAAILGASGAVFGLMGALMAMGTRLGSWQGKALAKQFRTWAIVLIGLGFLIPGVSNAGHVGGFVGGYLMGRLLPLADRNPLLFNLLGLASLGVILASFAKVLLVHFLGW